MIIIFLYIFLCVVVVFVLSVPPTAKVIWRQGHGLKLVKPGIKPATPDLQGKRFIHYTTVAPLFLCAPPYTLKY